MKKLALKLVQKYFLNVDPRFRPGDLVYYGNNDYEFELIGIYYSFQLKPFAFVRDPNNQQIFGVPLQECRSPYTR